jgi:hypothetical protein
MNCWRLLGPTKQIEVKRCPAMDHFTERTVHGPGGQLTKSAVSSFTVDLSKMLSDL